MESLVVDFVSDSKIGESPSRKHERRSADLARCRLRAETSDLVKNGKSEVRLGDEGAIEDNEFLSLCKPEEALFDDDDDARRGLTDERSQSSARPRKPFAL